MASAKVIIGSVVMPPGEYYVGDPCYAVPNDRWMEWLEAANYRDEHTILVAELDGHAVCAVNTAYGDGTYYDAAGNAYPVDAGLIGVTPTEIAADLWEGGLHLETFEEPFECRFDRESGEIWIGRIVIPTDPDDPDDLDDEGEA